MSVRTEKVSELIKHHLSVIIPKHVDTSTLGFVTVTEVRMTADLKLAKVYVSVFHSKVDKVRSIEMIMHHKKEIRMALGRVIQLKFTPDIIFYLDETLDQVQHLEELFKKIHSEEKTSE